MQTTASSSEERNKTLDIYKYADCMQRDENPLTFVLRGDSSLWFY